MSEAYNFSAWVQSHQLEVGAINNYRGDSYPNDPFIFRPFTGATHFELHENNDESGHVGAHLVQRGDSSSW